MILSVDPGMGGTGWALWDTASWELPVPPLETGIMNGRLRKGWTWLDKIEDLMDRFNALLVQYEPVTVYCEFPQFFSSAGGQMCAARGDLAKLTFLVGRIAESCYHHQVKFVPVEVNTWKGQLPKEVVEKRVCNKLGIRHGKITSHAMDAVGIGMWAKLGRL